MYTIHTKNTDVSFSSTVRNLSVIHTYKTRTAQPPSTMSSEQHTAAL